jgi:hypothetical protein
MPQKVTVKRVNTRMLIAHISKMEENASIVSRNGRLINRKLMFDDLCHVFFEIFKNIRIILYRNQIRKNCLKNL